MVKRKICNEYLDWMYSIVDDEQFTHGLSYRQLFGTLDAIEFTWIINTDQNRAADGERLRMRFADETGHTERNVESSIRRPCSVLEMMIALACRCEDQIMYDFRLGDRTAQWFWAMIDNLGLSDMDDENFNFAIVISKIDRFLNREYRRDGQGGMFIVRKRREDMRAVELWYQLCWWLNEAVIED